MKLLICFCVAMFGLSLVGCSQPQGHMPGDPLLESGMDLGMGPNETLNPGVILQGGDQGREGGHFVACDPQADIPSSRMNFELEVAQGTPEKVFFIDYFLEIRTGEERDALMDFASSDTDEERLDELVKRLRRVFNGVPSMTATAERTLTYAQSFMNRKGVAPWIPNTGGPTDHPVTTDVTVEDLPGRLQEILAKHCHSQLFQAAIYDYSTPGAELFYFSEFFEVEASLMQKSFRNVHELLRFLMRNETEQIVKLTTYFHTKSFWTSEVEQVRSDIARISAQFNNGQAFYASGAGN